MKKVLAVILSLVVVLGMAGCGNAATEPEPTPEPAPKFMFRGITFDSTKDEIIEMEQSKGSKIVELPVNLRIDNIDLNVVTAESLLYVFDKENPTKLNEIRYKIYGNTSQGEANLLFDKINTLYIDKYDTPLFTKEDSERPVFSDLGKNTAGLISGPAYKDSDFVGEIPQFSEWLLDSDGYWVDVVVFEKYYPAHLFYEVAVIYTVVPYSVTDAIQEAHDQAVQDYNDAMNGI